MNNAENALLAKAHALYAKRLTNENYSAMLECSSHNELFSYLKSSTHYGEALENLPSVQLSRARFENTMKQILLNRISSLCKFEKMIGEKLYKYFITKNEIETIIYCSRHLHSSEFIDPFTLPDFYKKEQCIYGEDLQKAHSFEELVSCLSGTPYEKILKTVMKSQGSLNLATVESALCKHLYTEAANQVKKSFKGNQRDEILSYFKTLSDMTMIESVIRINQFYSNVPNAKAGMYISPVSEFTEKQINALIESNSVNDVMKIIGTTRYKKYFRLDDNRPVEQRTREIIIKECSKQLRYSQNPLVCMFCYNTLAENEIKNITHIIEGIKYQLSPEEISKIIVKGEC